MYFNETNQFYCHQMAKVLTEFSYDTYLVSNHIADYLIEDDSNPLVFAS